MNLTFRSIGYWLLEVNNEMITRYALNKGRSSKKNTSKTNRFANIRESSRNKNRRSDTSWIIIFSEHKSRKDRYTDSLILTYR